MQTKVPDFNKGTIFEYPNCDGDLFHKNCFVCAQCLQEKTEKYSCH